MLAFGQICVCLAAVLQFACVDAIPVPFGDVEKAWKEGRSERDIHASALATPSFFHESRSSPSSDTSTSLTAISITSTQDNDFDTALDERSMAAKTRTRKGGLNVLVLSIGWGNGGKGSEGEDEAPVLRPTRGRRWYF